MSDKHEIATANVGGDVFVAVHENTSTYIYGPDGDIMMAFFTNDGTDINEQSLRLIVLSYKFGVKHGTNTGKSLARLEMRQALGL